MSCNNSSSGSSSNNNALSLSCIIIVAELLGVCCLKIIACLRGQQTATCQRSSLQRRRLPVSDAIICKIRLSTVIHQTQSAVYSLQLAVCSLQSEILSSLLAFVQKCRSAEEMRSLRGRPPYKLECVLRMLRYLSILVSEEYHSACVCVFLIYSLWPGSHG